MNPCRPKTMRNRGALMAAALLLMLVSGLFLSSWITLMSTRAVQVSHLEMAVQRRLGLENSRMLAWQCSINKGFQPGTTLGANQEGILGANFGGINTGIGWNDLNVYTSSSSPGEMENNFPYNYAGLRPLHSYLNLGTLGRPASLSSLDDFKAHLFMKTYPAVLAGDVFIAYRKPPTASTELDIHTANEDHRAIWTVEGRTVLRSPESLFARTTPGPLQLPFRTRSLYVQAHDPYNSRAVLGTDLDGKKLLPSNLPAMPSTGGPLTGSTDVSFAGYLDVIRNDANPDNSLWHFMDREKSAGRSEVVTLDVFTESESASGPFWLEEQKDPTYPPPRWPRGYPPRWRVLFVQLDHPDLPHMRIHGVVDQIVFRGQTDAAAFTAAGGRPPVLFAIVPMNSTGPSVPEIQFEGENNRRIVIGAKHWNAAPLNIYWPTSPISGFTCNWRTVFINEYQSIILNLPHNATRSVRWIGGVMTNWTFKRRAAGGLNSDRLVFAPDSSLPTITPSGPDFATMIPRDAWLESYFLPVPPPDAEH